MKAVVHKALRATARQCMQKINATEDDLEYLRKEPPFPEKSACILSCLMEKIGVVKNNKYSKNGFMVAISPLVIGNTKKVEHMRDVSEKCDNEINHHEVSNCQLGNEIISCIYKYAPELHFKN
ncbi:uncharacterized protein LOC119837466 [Zerene cesonia]|uniref:uncharacterized protein LOC119837466 n=1 Tax=Zerene cesonia TaxID=33412 RepID=UPI0018E571F3|nr:uncharacterized protein LOC119837466 [Zerene cesonia]